jgi:3-isopropylmalate dehydrogenase
MEERTIAHVPGDGAAPEMMKVAREVAVKAARHDGINLVFEETPAGWSAFEKFGDTMPASSLKRIRELGIVFFGGVGSPLLDDALGKAHPGMKPETHCLLKIRDTLGLLVNKRPVIITEELKRLTRLKIGKLPPGGIHQIWLRFLKQDTYFGTADLIHLVPPEIAALIGLKLKPDVTGDEERVVEFAYYSKAELEKYFRAAFKLAKSLGLPVISGDKANIMARYAYWRIIMQRIHDEEFPDVPLTHQLVDSLNGLLFSPERLHAVIVCGNEQGDTATDGANAIFKELGLMFSSSVNVDTGEAMFESGAGTAYTLAGSDVANPIGRIRTAGLMLEHVGAPNGAKAIDEIFFELVREGYRTCDIFDPDEDDPGKLVGTAGMGGLFLARL